MKISKSNQKEIESLKKVIEFEEGKTFNTDQIITRLLGFYKRYVPYS